jgi:predicted secreted protein
VHRLDVNTHNELYAADHSPARRNEHAPGGSEQVSLATIQSLEQQMPMSAAAAALGISIPDLRRACRLHGIRRWRHRAHAAAAAATSDPALRAVAYAANLRRRYGGRKEAAEAAVEPGGLDALHWTRTARTAGGGDSEPEHQAP